MAGAAHISAAHLERLLARRIDEAAQSGRRWVRRPTAFIRHLVDVACCAERTATTLRTRVAASDAPDPTVAFIAGAWHDAGKIWWGDDFHEIASALEVVEHGAAWGLVTGPDDQVQRCLRRAASVILPHFALAEQWRDDYQPSHGSRAALVPLFDRLTSALVSDQSDSAIGPSLYPRSVDDAILIFCDLIGAVPAVGNAASLAASFADRWARIAGDAEVYDPAIAALLPQVRPRLEGACLRVARLLGID